MVIQYCFNTLLNSALKIVFFKFPPCLSCLWLRNHQVITWWRDHSLQSVIFLCFILRTPVIEDQCELSPIWCHSWQNPQAICTVDFFYPYVVLYLHIPILSYKFSLLLFCSPDYEIMKGNSMVADKPPNFNGLTQQKFILPHSLMEVKWATSSL